MAFSPKIKEELLVASARHCCVCHRYRGTKLEIHHINPVEQGGKDTYENGIVLCFDCHSDAGHYYAKHPKGTKFTPAELKKHKEAWFKIVKDNGIKMPSDFQVELTFTKKENEGVFNPIFIEEEITFSDRTKFKKLYEDLKIDFLSSLEMMKTGNVIFDMPIRKVKNLDDYIDFLNGEGFKYLDENQKNEYPDPQPVLFSDGLIPNVKKHII